MLAAAARELQELISELVFVGGTTIQCYITDTGMGDIRPTVDVDCVVDAISLEGYYSFVCKMRAKGFQEDTTPGSPLCRFVKNELIIDLIPSDEAVLGFSNRWYKEGIQKAITVKVREFELRIFQIGFALAAKLEAFRSRGKSDFLFSHDLEDIIAIFDGNQNIARELETAHNSPELRAFLANEFSDLLSQGYFLQCIEAHINDRTFARERAEIVKRRFQAVLESLRS